MDSCGLGVGRIRVGRCCFKVVVFKVRLRVWVNLNSSIWKGGAAVLGEGGRAVVLDESGVAVLGEGGVVVLGSGGRGWRQRYMVRDYFG